MHALEVLLNRMKDWNFVAREKSLICMALRASNGLISFHHLRRPIAGRLDSVRRAVARKAGRRIGVAGLCRLAVNTLSEVLRLRGVAFGAFSGLQLCCCGHFVDVPMARSASVLTQNRVNAFRCVADLFGMAGYALHFGNFARVRKILDGSMTIGAGKSAVDACSMFVRANGDALAFSGFHVRLAVTGEAGFILLERLSGFFLATCQRVKR